MDCERNVILKLISNGFRYDDEDNLWYDENKDRNKYGYRIGISDNYKIFDLYYGGYDKKIGRFIDLIELLKNIK